MREFLFIFLRGAVWVVKWRRRTVRGRGRYELTWGLLRDYLESKVTSVGTLVLAN